MSNRITLIFFVLVIPACSNQNPPRTKLLQAQKMTLYSLHSDEAVDDQKTAKQGEQYQGYEVLGKIEITDPAQMQKILDTMHRGLSEEDKMHKCFIPRHGLHIEHGKQVQDLVICFKCRQMTVVGAETYVISTSPQPLLDKILSDAKIPLRKEQSQ